MNAILKRFLKKLFWWALFGTGMAYAADCWHPLMAFFIFALLWRVLKERGPALGDECPVCHGDGVLILGGDACLTCGGKGYLPTVHELTTLRREHVEMTTALEDANLKMKKLIYRPPERHV